MPNQPIIKSRFEIGDIIFVFTNNFISGTIIHLWENEGFVLIWWSYSNLHNKSFDKDNANSVNYINSNGTLITDIFRGEL